MVFDNIMALWISVFGSLVDIKSSLLEVYYDRRYTRGATTLFISLLRETYGDDSLTS